jgi:hypothetical protein
VTTHVRATASRLGARAAARLSHALHPRRLLRIARAVMLKGANLNEVGFELTMLVLFVAAYAFLALTRFRRTLD